MRHTSPARLAAAVALALAAAPRPSPAQDRAAPPPGPPATLIGRVVDDARCTPLAGAVVRLAGDAARTAVADSSGRFRFAGGGTPTTWAIAVTHGGYRPVPARPVAADSGAALAYAEVRLQPDDGGGGTAAPGAAPRVVGVSTVPARPTQGSLFRLRVVLRDAAGGTPPAGRLGGERLHFVRVAAGTYESLAAAPLDAPDSLALVLGADADADADAAGGDATDAAATRLALPIARGDFPLERLRVAPEFGRAPDLALAERLERESEQARDVGCGAHRTPRLWTAPFARPRPGRVTSRFGRGREYNGTVTSRHTGTDFAGATGAPVTATNRGVVRLVGRFYLGGTVVYLDHGAGVVSAYMHLSRTAVAVGDTVARGQVIGRVGSTGRVTGPHLHWVVRYGRTSVDPESLLAVGGGRER